MTSRLLILLLWMAMAIPSQGQLPIDSVYQSRRLVPRFGLHIQQGYALEAGLQLNRFSARTPRHPGIFFIPYSSSGFYLSSEAGLIDFERFFIGPKIGWELGVAGETHASYFGVEFINYTDFDKYSPAFLFKIGLPALWFNIWYGYSLFLETSLQEDIGRHRLGLSFVINRRAYQGYQQIRRNAQSIKKEEPQPLP